jgi:hypothetical protein
VHKTEFLLPVQFRLTSSSLVNVTPLFKYHKKILILSGTLSFHKNLFCQIFPIIKDEYIDFTVNCPFWVNPYLNTSAFSFDLTWTIFETRLNHWARLSPNKDRLKDTLRGTLLKTDATESCLCRTILNKFGKCCFSGTIPIHLSSQKQVFAPSLIMNVPRSKKQPLILIRPDQKWES